MIINRHNYEEFFLLYVDGELAPAEREAVEMFVAENTDLAAELEMLQQSVLLPDDISFDGKEALLKFDQPINDSNYQEFFLLSVDNELTKEEEQLLENFVLQHPATHDEFQLLKQTKLPVEVVLHPNKAELYKKESEDRKVVPIRWLRVAVAAAIIIIAGSLLFVQRDSNVNDQPVVALQPDKKVQPVNTPAEVIKPAPVVAGNKHLAATSEKKGLQNTIPAVAKSPLRKGAQPQVKQDNGVIEAPVYKAPKLLPPTEEMMAALIKEPKESTPLRAKETGSRNNRDAGMEMIAANTPEGEKEIVQHTVYTEDDDENNTIYVGAAALNKKKLKSLFKRATALFDKKESTDDEKTIKIASFQIRSK